MECEVKGRVFSTAKTKGKDGKEPVTIIKMLIPNAKGESDALTFFTSRHEFYKANNEYAVKVRLYVENASEIVPVPSPATDTGIKK